MEQQHADYPHTPGALYDCLACESECFCMDDFECLFCSLTEEADCV